MTEHIDMFLSEWTAAERDGDTSTLATLLTDDFYCTGPLGFVLAKQAWLDRHRQGLAYEQFGLDEVQVRLYGDVALVSARNSAHGTFRGQPVPVSLRSTLVIVSCSESPRLVAIHMSFIAGTQGSPLMQAPNDVAESTVQMHADGEQR